MNIIQGILLIIIFFSNIIFVKAQSFDGFALYNSQGSNTTYLVDENQQVAHSWQMNSECNYTVQLKKNGNLVRGTKNPGNILNGAADGGKVQEIAPDGSIVWEYVYSSADYLSHHDLTLVGDNVLLTAWEVKTPSQLDSLGYNNPTSDKWPTHFIELEPDGNGGANIVWEWHIWDHLCQDVAPNKPNYVVNIADHPELIDINMIQPGGGQGGGQGDWFHVNGVDYNEELDQIVFSSRFASEIYIIDHSTTTAEAASHTGGNSGMGGDILYRWGNPSNYGMTMGSQIIPSAVHDSRWIKNDGRPNGGFLQIFNNCGGGCTGGGPSGIVNSTIDGIETPWDPITNKYLRNPGQPFEPFSYTTRYSCQYSSSGQSASDRMSNGNIYVNASGGQGGAGVMYEVDSLGFIIWGPYPAQSQKGFRYECDYEGIIALQPYMQNTTTTSCFDPTFVNDDQSNNFSVFPNPTNGKITLNLESNEAKIQDIYLSNILGEIISIQDLNFINNKIDINLEGLSEGIYLINISFDNDQFYTQRISYIK